MKGERFYLGFWKIQVRVPYLVWILWPFDGWIYKP